MRQQGDGEPDKGDGGEGPGPGEKFVGLVGVEEEEGGEACGERDEHADYHAQDRPAAPGGHAGEGCEGGEEHEGAAAGDVGVCKLGSMVNGGTEAGRERGKNKPLICIATASCH